jgi:hypothetical protein
MSQTLKASSTRDNAQMIERARKRLSKRAKRGFRGYPLATVALYGPDDRTATKFAVGIVPAEHADATELRRWFLEGADIRNDADIAEEVLAFVAAAGARSVVTTDTIIGCPHEEGIDYQGPTCAHSGRDAIVGPERAHTSAVVESLGPIPIGCAARSTGTLPDPGRLRRIWVASAVDRGRLIL